MKKNYIAPNTKVFKVQITARLMQNSISGASGLGNHSLTVGGSTSSADSRRGSWGWDDEEDW